MNNSNADARIFRRLRTAYAQLLQENGIDEITVTELTGQADMSRATFYLHYSNMDEFRNECFRHIVTTALRQCGLWFEAGRDGIEEASKKKNLIMNQNDRDLFRFYMSQEIYKQYHYISTLYDTRTAMHIFTDTWSDDFIDQNSGKLTVFFTGFIVNSMPDLTNYSSKKLRREMEYIFEIWDYLFPGQTENT
ncbi:MAG: TetR/AcrR family transcriptional regulator [Ruminococcaceae bacterium]|nr:TetR/AcrR family transcriptional regulator [Oscillospiraceae bacterium]